MPSLLDSGRIVFPTTGSTLSVKESARQCGFGFPLSLRHFLNTPTRACPFLVGVRFHLKVLQEPDVSISTMVRSMITVFRTVRLRVEVGSHENLRGPGFATLLDLDVGPCTADQSLTTEQTQLYQNRNNVNNNKDIVIYFVRRVLKNNTMARAGCAAPKQPTNSSVAIAQTASRWTLAHEVGHKLGLNHIAGESTNCPPNGPPNCLNTCDSTRLMTGCGTDLITGTPTLSITESNTMSQSPLRQFF